jgi:ABC-type amino acid transport substrate-binding protein
MPCLRTLALCLWCVCAVHAGAQPASYTVGVQDYENYLPYSEYKQGEYRGLSRDVLDAFAKAQGYAFVYQVLPLKRRDAMFVRGELDFAFPDNPNWVTVLKQGRHISYAPVLEFTDGVLVRQSDKGKPLARIKTLGIPLGFTPYPYQQMVNSGAMRLEESARYDKLYEKLARGHVDAAYMNTRVAEHYWRDVARDARAPAVYDPDLPHASDFHYLASFKHPEVIARFRDFMKNNKALVDELKRRYGFQ